MKAINKKAVSEMTNVAITLVEEKPFSIEDTTKVLGRELCGYSLASDKVDALRLEIKNFSDTKIERKKNIDKVLKDLFTHDAKMLTGRGMSKCVIRNTLRAILEDKDSGLKKATSDNYLSAISWSLRTKRPFDAHYSDTVKKENDTVEKSLNAHYMQKGLELSQSTGLDAVLSYFADCIIEVKALAIKNDTDDIDRDNLLAIHDKVQKEIYPIIESVIKQQKENTPTAPTAPTAPMAPTAPTAPASKKNTRLDYCKDASAIVRQLFDATQFRKCLNDSDMPYYDDIIDSIKDIMESLALLVKDKDYVKHIDDMQDDDTQDDDNLDIDSELVD
jgi:ribosome assembly protein YihI (activator of Der GTPase)